MPDVVGPRALWREKGPLEVKTEQRRTQRPGLGVTGEALEQPRGDVLCFSSLTMHRTGPNRSAGARRSWVIQMCRAETRHGRTGVPLDDRLWVARGGRPVPEPTSERPFDLRALLEDAPTRRAEAP